MNSHTLTEFFMWCSIINGAFLFFVAFWCMFTPNLMYRLQTKWFSIPQETFNVVIYSFLGVFKIMFLIFNLVPFLVLLIIQ